MAASNKDQDQALTTEQRNVTVCWVMDEVVCLIILSHLKAIIVHMSACSVDVKKRLRMPSPEDV